MSDDFPRQLREAATQNEALYDLLSNAADHIEIVEGNCRDVVKRWGEEMAEGHAKDARIKQLEHALREARHALVSDRERERFGDEIVASIDAALSAKEAETK